MAMNTTGQADLLDLMIALRAQHAPHVVEIEGSAAAKPGAKALIGQDGTLLAGWAGGGCAEAAVRQAALDCLRDGGPCYRTGPQ